MLTPRMLVVGLDGATFDVLTPLAESGVMPNLRALMAESALAEVRSTQPAITPTAWSTFLTGCDPAWHGVLDYRRLNRDGSLSLNHAQHLRCATIFDHLAAEGSAAVSLNLPMTAARTGGDDLIVGGIDCLSSAAALAPYPAFAERLAERGIRLSLKTLWQQRPQSYDELAAGVAATERDFLDRSAAARVADELVDWRLMFVQFQSLDCLQHRLWHLFDFAGGGGPAPWLDQVRCAFRALDRAVGELIELAAQRGAGIAVVSDHGFGPFREKISVPEILRRAGLLFPQSATERVTYRAARTWLKLRKWSGRRLSRQSSAAGVRRSLAALLPLDWRRSVAFSAHGNLGALIYLNSVARFGAGPVATPAQAEQTTADCQAALAAARHPDTDEPLFVDVFSTAQRYGIDPVEHDMPEVIGIPADGFHTRHKFDRGYKLMRPDADLTGTHRTAGVLMARVPGAMRGQHHQAELRDVAPTLLHWLGCRGAETMQGRVLDELVNRPTAASSQPSPRVETHTVAASYADPTEPDEQIVLERLRTLGYID